MNKINRREFHGHLVGAGTALLALTTVELEGCSALDNLISWVPVGLAAFDGLATIIDGPFTTVATTVDALWAAVQNAISLYQHSTDPMLTRLDRVIAALDALAGGLTQALAALPISIPANVLKGAQLALALLIATLKSIRDHLQAPTPAPTAIYAAAATATPAKNTKDFVNKFNAIMTANGIALAVKA